MERKYLRNALLSNLALKFKINGYYLIKSQGEFVKKTSDGWWKFQLIFLERSFGWEVNIGLLIRKNLVEDIYHKASYYEPKYHKTTPTAGITVEKLINDGKQYRFQISNDYDIKTNAKYIEQLFYEVAEPFFMQYDSISNLDKAINIDQGNSIFSGPKYEGNTGIILAKLANNPNYMQLEKRYYDYYKKSSNGFYLPEYEGILSVLRTMFD